MMNWDSISSMIIATIVTATIGITVKMTAAMGSAGIAAGDFEIVRKNQHYFHQYSVIKQIAIMDCWWSYY